MLCAALVVVQELPLLIFRMMRGESQPESGVFELLVDTSGGCWSLSSVDGSCGGGGVVCSRSGSGICFNVIFGAESVSESLDLEFVGMVLMVNFGIRIGSGSSRSMLIVTGS